jgi:RNA polymerase sigma-70 factor (ECF subfamily)
MAVAEGFLRHGWLEEGPSDRTLILEAQSGRAEAAATLIERYYPRVYSFVSHLTYGRGNAEDLTQEAFTRALKALGRFNGQYQFEHWLLRIARNLCIDEARRNQRRPEPTDPLELPELDKLRGGDYVWESVARHHLASTIQEALAKLPPRQREILILREIEGMSYADIARVVDTNHRGVEATLRRARARFRLEMARVESAEGERAVCRRILRIIANNPGAVGAGEASRHLAQCRDCRNRARSIRSADKALGLLPPIFGADWLRQQIASFLRRLSDRARSLGDTLRAVPQGMIASPMTPILHATATLVIAAGVAAGSASAASQETAVSAHGVTSAPQQAEAAQPEADAILVGGVPSSVSTPARPAGRAAASRVAVPGAQPAHRTSDRYQPPGLPLDLSNPLNPAEAVSALTSGLGVGAPVDLTAVIEALAEAVPETLDTTALEVVEEVENAAKESAPAMPSKEQRPAVKIERPQPKKMRPANASNAQGR